MTAVCWALLLLGTSNAWEFMISLGFLGAACVRVSNELGRGNAKAAKFSIKVLLGTSIAIRVFFFVLCLIFRRKLAYVFTDDERVADTVSDLSLLLSFSVLLNSIYPVLSGYMDPEYVVTQELTEKSDIYSYGVVLLELITSRRAIHDNRNLVEACQSLLTSASRHRELVDPAIGDSFDLEQLQTVVTVVKWCTHREGRARPSIKQVLRLLYECADPMYDGFIEAVEDERGRISKGRIHRRDSNFQSWDGRGLASSSSTSRSYCSRSFLLETGSPQSP